jgi:hypothetical protein
MAVRQLGAEDNSTLGLSAVDVVDEVTVRLARWRRRRAVRHERDDDSTARTPAGSVGTPVEPPAYVDPYDLPWGLRFDPRGARR